MNEKPVVIITGATGYIGSATARRLCDDYHVVGLDLEKSDSDWAGEKWVACDLTSDESVDSALIAIRNQYGVDIESVLHLAAYYDFSGEPSPMYEKLTVEGSKRLMNGLRRFDRVGQFVFSSSLLVMKPVENEDAKLTESSETRAEWAYPRSKLQAEAALESAREDIPLVMLRIAGVYDDQCRSLPIGQHIRRIYEKHIESYFFPGDADRGQPFVHIDDLIDCFAKVIENRTELDDVSTFLIAEPEVASHRELQDTLGELIHGDEWPTIRIPKAAAKAGAKAKSVLPGNEDFIKPWMIDMADDHYPVAIERARKKLGWSPEHRLLDELPKMIDLLKRDPERFYEINKLPVSELSS